MERKKGEKEWKVPVTIRIDPEIEKKFKFIADSIFGNKATILSECIRLGFEELKKHNPIIAEASRNWDERHGEVKKRANLR